MTRIRALVSEKDSNLKYLGLLALKLLLAKDPSKAMVFRDSILTCFQSEDLTIKIKALQILTLTMTKDTFKTIIGDIMDSMEKE